MKLQNSPARLLFVGNSYTFRNDLPGLVAQLAPHRVETRNIVAGGASLRRHINSGAVAAALEAEDWDVVILQEQSTLPVKNASRFAASVRELNALIIAHGARTALYQTWARQNAPESQSVLSESYAELAAELGALLIPVGEVWSNVLETHPALQLFDADGSHPAPLGSYLAACVFTAKLWNLNPQSLTVPAALKISVEQAAVARTSAANCLS